MEEVKKSDKKLFRKFCRDFRRGLSDKVINMFEELHPMIRHELVLQSFEMHDTSELAKFVLNHEKLKPTDEDKYAFLKCMGIKAEGEKFDSYEDDEDFIIASWNVNGIRARIFNELTSAQCKKSKTKEIAPNSSLNKLINDADPSVICFQEIKCDSTKLKCFGVNGEKRSDGWYTYWNCAKKLNYSGVGIMSKQKAKEIDTGLLNSVNKVGLPEKLFHPDSTDEEKDEAEEKFMEIAMELESEGRILCAKYTYKSKDVWIINLYSPNTLRAGARKANGEYPKPHFIYRRRVWEKLILLKIEHLMRSCPVILCGDLNVARSQRDIYHGFMTTALLDLQNEPWRTDLHENLVTLAKTAKVAKKMEIEAGAGYRREERRMMENLLSFQLDDEGSEIHMHDVWREKHPEDLQEIIEQGEGYDYGFTFWDPKNLPHRPKNFGWRIDYFLVDDNILKDYSLEINVFPEVGEKVYDDQGEVVLSSGGNEVVASDHAPIVLTIKDVELKPNLVEDLNTIADKILEEEEEPENMDLDDVVVVNPDDNVVIDDTSDSDLSHYEEDNVFNPARRVEMIKDDPHWPYDEDCRISDENPNLLTHRELLIRADADDPGYIVGGIDDGVDLTPLMDVLNAHREYIQQDDNRNFFPEKVANSVMAMLSNEVRLRALSTLENESGPVEDASAVDLLYMIKDKLTGKDLHKRIMLSYCPKIVGGSGFAEAEIDIFGVKPPKIFNEIETFSENLQSAKQETEKTRQKTLLDDSNDEDDEDINYSELFEILNDYEQETEWTNNNNFSDFMENLPLKLSKIGYMSGKLCYDEINNEIMSPDNFNILKSALEQNIKLLDEKSEKLTNDSDIILQLVSEIAKHNEEIKELNDKVAKLRKELADGFDENERAIDVVRHQQDIDYNTGLATDKYRMTVKGLEEDLAEKEESLRAELLDFLNIYSVVMYILLFFTILCMKINKIPIPGINPMQLFRTLDSLLAKTELSALKNNLRKDRAYRKTLQ